MTNVHFGSLFVVRGFPVQPKTSSLITSGGQLAPTANQITDGWFKFVGGLYGSKSQLAQKNSITGPVSQLTVPNELRMVGKDGFALIAVPDNRDDFPQEYADEFNRTYRHEANVEVERIQFVDVPDAAALNNIPDGHMEDVLAAYITKFNAERVYFRLLNQLF